MGKPLFEVVVGADHEGVKVLHELFANDARYELVRVVRSKRTAPERRTQRRTGRPRTAFPAGEHLLLHSLELGPKPLDELKLDFEREGFSGASAKPRAYQSLRDGHVAQFEADGGRYSITLAGRARLAELTAKKGAA